MNNEIFNQIALLIENKMGKFKRPMSKETSLEKDLGISGDDAVELLIDFGKSFNVDMSEFEITKYFYPEGDSILPDVLRSFKGSKNPKQSELTLGHLEKAAIAGRLNEEVISG